MMEEKDKVEDGPEPMDLYPETIDAALKQWDDGDVVWTIEMGGLGPGYEQAIQVGVIELCRRIKDLELPDSSEEDENGRNKLNEFLDAHLHKVCRDVETLDGLSGAQAGAIKNLAYNYYTYGWRDTLLKVDRERRTMISNSWPRRKDD